MLRVFVIDISRYIGIRDVGSVELKMGTEEGVVREGRRVLLGQVGRGAMNWLGSKENTGWLTVGKRRNSAGWGRWGRAVLILGLITGGLVLGVGVDRWSSGNSGEGYRGRLPGVNRILSGMQLADVKTEESCVKRAMKEQDEKGGCQRIRNCLQHNDLDESEDFVGYLEFHFCVNSGMRWRTLPLLMTMLAILVYVMIWIADDYLSPSLAGVADSLKLSPEIAGVTFLALGNGAPDISSTFASVQSRTFSIAAAELIGAAFFVTTVVVAAVGMVSNASLERGAFRRNIVFLLGAVIALTSVVLRGHVHLWEAGFFILYYVAYLFIVLYREGQGKYRAVSERMTMSHLLPLGEDSPLRRNPLASELSYDSTRDNHSEHNSDIGQFAPEGSNAESDEESPHKLYNAVDAALKKAGKVTIEASNEESTDSDDIALAGGPSGASGIAQSLTDLVRTTSKVIQGFRQRFAVVSQIPQTPLQHLLRFTIPPLIRSDDEWTRWIRITLIMNPVTVPLFMLLVSETASVKLFDLFPLWTIAISVGAVGSFLVYKNTTDDFPPEPTMFLYLVGFVSSVFWMFCTAREVVRLIKAIGSLMQISYSVLGMTVLAWGNSIGDFISNTAIARQGQPKMAIAACYSSPMFNLVFSLGLALTVQCIRDYPAPYMVKKMGAVFYSTSAFLVVGLVASAVVVIRSGFVVTSRYSKFLFSFYLICAAVNAYILLCQVKLPWT